MTNHSKDKDFLNALAQIRITQGAKAKQSILKPFEEYKEYLHLAYSPYLNFFVGAERIRNYSIGTDDTIPTPAAFLPVSRREYTGNKAIEYLEGLCTGKTKEVSDFIRMVIDKDLKIGMNAKTLNKVFPKLIDVFEIMLAERENKEKFLLHFGKYPWVYFNEKIDGIRCIAKVSEDGTVNFVSRSGKPIPEFLTENIEKDLRSVPAFRGKVLDGEIASKNFQDLQKVIMRKSADMDSMMIRNSCRMYVFDILMEGTLEERLVYVDMLPETVFVKKLKYYKIHSDFSLIKDVAKRYIASGREGIIVKKPDAPYEGKRSFSWMKFKGKESLDLKVIRIERGEGKYSEVLGALVLDYEGKELHCGTGFTDGERLDLWEKRESIPGMICQISFMEKTNESVRHPVFECLRIDKTEADV